MLMLAMELPECTCHLLATAFFKQGKWNTTWIYCVNHIYSPFFSELVQISGKYGKLYCAVLLKSTHTMGTICTNITIILCSLLPPTLAFNTVIINRGVPWIIFSQFKGSLAPKSLKTPDIEHTFLMNSISNGPRSVVNINWPFLDIFL